MLFRKKKIIEEQNKLIEELTNKILEQQKLLNDANAQLEDFRQREYAISRAITDAAETANRIVSDAQKESDTIHESAQRDFMASQKKGEEMISTAYENARDIIKDAEKASEKKIKETDDAVSSYVQILNQFNESMKEQARQAEENVKKLSDYYARLNSALPELFAEVPLLNSTVDKDKPLPDPEGDPAQLMRNIYALQNRFLPHDNIPDRTSIPVEKSEEEQNIHISEQVQSKERFIPHFDAEDGDVLKVSDIIQDDVGFIDTDELIAQTASMGSRSMDEE